MEVACPQTTSKLPPQPRHFKDHQVVSPSQDMATVVPFASCYGDSSPRQPLQLFGKGPQCDYMSLITYRSPRNVAHPRLACSPPKLTLRQIYRMLRVLRYEATAAANPRKQASSPPGSPVRSDRRFLPSCFRRRRSITNVKRVG
ncbi:hypothetical protein DPEC_G00215930 [Dallia pectoralis]|uniref:Uncharacterized protein n=1 Tax=Dallia pectoralis TaxID=75939 RepID=A0ACC2G2G2_DALPE|nr:hypothetical protein DPEC_G00215930 [Dallia pectoralis]